MASGKKIIIIGSGIIGICTAYYLQKKGHEVIVLDQGEFGNGTSFGNAGMIVPSHFIPLAAPGMIAMGIKWMFNPESPFHIKPRLSKDLLSWGWKFYQAATAEKVKTAMPVLKELNLRSRMLYEEMAEKESWDFAFQKKGLLMYCKTPKALHEEGEMAKEAKKLGIKAEVLSAQEAQSLDPGAKLDIAGAVYFPMDAFLTPHLLMQGLRNKLIENGVVFHDHTQFNSFEIKNNKITGVQTNKGQFLGDEFVMAAGSWSANLLRDLKINIPLMAGKGYSFVVPNPVAMPEICSILTEARVAVTPMAHGLRFGGTMELAGLDLGINQRRLQGIYKSIPQYFPEFKISDFTDLKVWSGLRPCSPDGLPYIGRAGSYSNLIVATGHSMMGLSLGPITGKMIAQIVSHERPEIDSPLLAVDRYL